MYVKMSQCHHHVTKRQANNKAMPLQRNIDFLS